MYSTAQHIKILLTRKWQRVRSGSQRHGIRGVERLSVTASASSINACSGCNIIMPSHK